jgi:homogentisate 1,2-dioxygenase
MDRVFGNVDAEMLLIPQRGRLQITTELGRLDVAPGEIALLPRALRFRVDLPDGECTGYACENFGPPFRLPELGPIGSNGLALPRDFLAPEAWYEDDTREVGSICKYGGVLWRSVLKRSCFDVVAWHGTHVPYKYDLRRFNAVQSVTFDHTDPSVFTALTSPTAVPGTANADFCVIPPRWIVANDTFRPPYFHRNVMAEFVISIQGKPEARGSHYDIGSAHLHNRMVPHGPDPDVFVRASQADLKPVREETLMVMFESEVPFVVTSHALESPRRVRDYESNWERMPVRFVSPAPH